MFGSYGSIVGFVDLDTHRLDMGVTRAAASLKGLEAGTSSVGKAFKGLGIGIGVVGAVIAGASIKMAADFDQNMRKVWSLTRESEETFKRWGTTVKEMSRDLPQSAAQMADAFYWIKSDMPDATDAQQLATLEIAARGAVGGVADLSDTVIALVGAQNAYKEMDPAKYMDIMNKAVERGSVTLQDFVSNQGKFVGTAAQFKIPFEEVAAAMATLTRNAIPADTAAMAINQTMMAYLKPTEEAAAIAKTHGIELSANTLKTRGFGGAMMDLADAMKDDNSEIAQMFPNIRSLKAILPLSGLAAQEFAKDLNEMGVSAGTSANMFEKNVDSLQNKWLIAWGKAQLILINFGEKILPMVSSAFDTLGRIFDGKNEVFNSFATAAKRVGEILWNLGGTIAHTTPLLIGLIGAFATMKTLGFVSGLMASIGSSIGALPGVFSWLGGAIGFSSVSLAGLAGPIGIAIGAAAGLGFGIYEVIHGLTEYSRVADKANAAALPFAEKMEELKVKLIDTSVTQDEYNQLLAEFDDNLQKAAAASPAFIEEIDSEGKVIKYASDQLIIYEAMLGHRSKAMNESTQAGKREAETVSDLIKSYTDEQVAMNDAAAARRALEEHVGMVYKPVDVGGGVIKNQLVRDTAEWNKEMQHAIANAASAKTQVDLLRGDINGMVNAAAVDFYRLGQSSQSMADAMNAGLGQIMVALNNADPMIRERARNMLGAFAAGWGEARGWTDPQVTDFVTHLSTLLVMPNMAGIGGKAMMDFVGGLMENKDVTWEQVNGLVVGIEEQLRALNAGEISQTQFQDYVTGLVSAMGVAPEKVAGVVKTLMASLEGGGAAGAKGEESGTAWSENMAGGIEGKKGAVQKAVTDMVNGIKIPQKELNIEPKLTKQELTVKVNVEPGKKESPFVPMPADEIGRYIAQKIQSGYESNLPNLQAGVMVGGAGIPAGSLTSDIAALDAAWTALNQTALVWWSQSVDNTKFGEIEQAIVNLGAPLDQWRAMLAALDEANAKLKEYQTELSKVQSRQDEIQNTTGKWRDSNGKMHSSLTALQERLNKINQRINDVKSSTDGWRDANGKLHKSLATLQQMKMAGEGAASDESFAQQQEINALELERLKIEAKGVENMTAADFQRLMDIDIQKQQLEIQKQITDKQAEVDYAADRRELEKMLDPLHGQEMTYEQIVAEIKKAQHELALQEKRQGYVSDEIAVANAELQKCKNSTWELNKEITNASKVVSDYEQRVNQMANNFLEQYRKMIAAQEELNRAMAQGGTGGTGGTGQSFASGGDVLQTGYVYAHAGEHFLTAEEWRTLRTIGIPVAPSSSTDNSRREVHNNYYLDKVVLPNVRDFADFKRDLSNARLRPQVS